MNASEKVIVALDCREDEALALAQKVQGSAVWLKVGLTLYYSAGPSIIGALKAMGYQVFADLKLHDIPHQVRGAAASAVAAGADMLTVHASGGMAMMQAAVEGARQAFEQREQREQQLDRNSQQLNGKNQQPSGGAKPILLAVTVLTSMDEASLQTIGVGRDLTTQVNSLAQLAKQAGLDGVVASPLEATQLRKLLGENFAIVTPGVRPASSAPDDQSRTATPAQAIANGASHLVVGRPITGAGDPRVAFEAIVDEIRRAQHG